MADLFQLGSFILMIYTAGIAFYVSWRAVRVGLPYLLLALFLSLMILFHGIHHLFAFVDNPILEQDFEFGASLFALALALVYVYVWRRY